MNSLIKEVDASYADYEPTKAARAIQEFVTEHLSNWYVRLSRRRFWKGEYSDDKKVAYQTLYTCLDTLSRLMAPIAPFFADHLFTDLNTISKKDKNSSVHLAQFPMVNESLINKDLEERMQLAQDISSMALSLRKKVNIKVRQPLQKILLPVVDAKFKKQVLSVQDLIIAEVNVEEIEFLEDATTVLVKKIKPNFKALGPKVGGLMKQLSASVSDINQEQIAHLEKKGMLPLNLGAEAMHLSDSLLEDQILKARRDVDQQLHYLGIRSHC